MTDREQQLQEFVAALDQAEAKWDHAMATGDTAAIEADMPEGIVCYFAARGMQEAQFNDRASIIAGMRQSIGKGGAARKRFENRIIRMRSEDEAVVFFEQIVGKEDQVYARLFTIETWRLMDGQWRCVREIVEHAGA